MRTRGKLSQIDLGRLAAIVVFSFFMIINFLYVNKEIRNLFPIDATKTLDLIHSLLVAAFYILVVSLYFLRTSATATTRSLPAKFIAVLASFVPFFIPLLGRPAGTSPVMLTASNLVMLASIVFVLIALATLGKSFSIIPQTRRLVVHGPYGLMRHPLYFGEIIGVLGLVLADVSIPRILLFLLLVACQIYRALEEEKLLTSVFPEYSDYASKKARFIPGLF